MSECPFDQREVTHIFRHAKGLCSGKHEIKGATFSGITKSAKLKIFKSRTPLYGSMKLSDGMRIHKVHINSHGKVVGTSLDEDGVLVKLVQKGKGWLSIRTDDEVHTSIGNGIVVDLQPEHMVLGMELWNTKKAFSKIQSFQKVPYSEVSKVLPTRWRCVRTLPEVCWKQCAFSANGRYLVVVDYRNPNLLTVYDTLDFRPVHRISDSETPIASLTFSDNNRFFAVTSQDRYAYIYDPSSFTLIQKLWLDCWTDFDILLHEKFFCLFSEQFLVVWFAPSRVVCLWDTRIWKARQFQETDLIGNVAFHPNNPDELVVRLLTGKIHRWDLSNLKFKKERTAEIAFCEPETGLQLPPVPLSFSSKGAFLALCCHDNTIKIFDTVSWEKITELHDESGNMNHCSYSKKFLATSYNDGTLCLWNTRAKKMFETMCDTPIVQVACCPQGKYLVTVHECGSLSWWRE